MTTTAIDYDPIDPQCHERCFEIYPQLLEQAPVYRTAAGVFVVSRYDDVRHVLKTPSIFSSQAMQSDMMGMVTDPGEVDLAAFSALVEGMPVTLEEIATARMFIATDPPRHTDMRRIVNRGFLPRRVQKWSDTVDALVASSMATLAENERFDLIDVLARPVPLAIIAEVCSIEPERMYDFKSWMDGYLEAAQGPDAGTPEALARLLGYFKELINYLVPRIVERQENPQDDLISDILRAEESEVFSTGDALFTLFILVGGGVSTTQHLIGNTVLALLQNPDQLELLLARPELLSAAIEESVRYHSPVQILWRDAVEDAIVQGIHISKGSKVVALVGAANRDPRQFPDPEKFNIERPNLVEHLGFGVANHYCIGSALGRLTSKAALTALLPLLPGLRPDLESLELTPASFLWGHERMDLVPR